MGGEVVPTYVFISRKPGLPWWLSGEESACNAGGYETQVRSLGQDDPLEQETAIPSIRAWTIPWTEEATGLWQATVHNLGTKPSPLVELVKSHLCNFGKTQNVNYFI